MRIVIWISLFVFFSNASAAVREIFLDCSDFKFESAQALYSDNSSEDVSDANISSYFPGTTQVVLRSNKLLFKNEIDQEWVSPFDIPGVDPKYDEEGYFEEYCEEGIEEYICYRVSNYGASLLGIEEIDMRWIVNRITGAFKYSYSYRLTNAMAEKISAFRYLDKLSNGMRLVAVGSCEPSKDRRKF